MKKETRERKTRADKKRDVKPTIPIQLYECIARISYVTNTPIKDVAETICKKGLISAVVLEHLSNHFRRDFWADSHVLYPGNVDRPPYRLPSKGIAKRRISIRFQQQTHDKLARLAYSLDMTISSATAFLLQSAIMNTDIVNHYISLHVKKNLDKNRMKQLKEVLRYINMNNPYEEEISLGALVSFIVDEFRDTASSLQRSVQRFLEDQN